MVLNGADIAVCIYGVGEAGEAREAREAREKGES
jgi:hypothetical protein